MIHQLTGNARRPSKLLEPLKFAWANPKQFYASVCCSPSFFKALCAIYISVLDLHPHSTTSKCQAQALTVLQDMQPKHLEILTHAMAPFAPAYADWNHFALAAGNAMEGAKMKSNKNRKTALMTNLRLRMIHTSAKLALPAGEWTPQWIASILPMRCYRIKLIIRLIKLLE